MGDREIQTRYVGYFTAMPRLICIIKATNYSANMKWVRHWQFQEKKKAPTTELIFFVSKIFLRKIVNLETHMLNVKT